MKKNIIKKMIAFSMLSVLLTGCSNIKLDLDKDFNKYNKEESQDYSFDVSGDKLSVDSNCSNDITIKKDNVDKIQVKFTKSVSGNDEEKVDEILERLELTYDKGVINIKDPQSNWVSLISMNNKTEIVIPKSISELDLESDVGDINIDGDYKNLDFDSDIGDANICGNYEIINLKQDTGDLEINGEVKSCNIDSDTGDVKLNLNNIKDDYNYTIKRDIGGIDINIPNSSEIKLSGNLKDKAKIGEGIICADKGAEFNLSGDISTVTINAK